ncbi:DUF4012 domain-containing protein [Pseudarthrobacter siccitolerans]
MSTFTLRTSSKKGRSPRRRRFLMIALSIGGVAFVLGGASTWLAIKASTINAELNESLRLIAPLKEQISTGKTDEASVTVDQLRVHTASARRAAGDPLWSLASALPLVGPNFSAVAEVARSADDVAGLGLAPLARVLNTLDWDSILPSSSGSNLAPLKEASPSITSAAHAVRLSAERLDRIDASQLLPQVADPLSRASGQLREASVALDTAADASALLPEMLGGGSPRNYLLMIQNNAESRASGGIPGALAILTIENGKMTLGTQTTAASLGIMSPVLATEIEQRQIYTERLGKFMQDVNLTPDFPTAAGVAQAMWEKKTGQRVNGVLSIDPVALSYVLKATGPVDLTSAELVDLAGEKLPTRLDSSNVVQTLLSDVYAEIEAPQSQDLYFAGVAQEIFASLSSGRSQPNSLVEAITRGVEEGRVLVWSGTQREQSVIANYRLSGSVSGRSVAPAQFGVYFNDGTGAKMDYYVKRSVQLIKECPKDGYEQTTVRVTSTNTAPTDAATSLSPYVTGSGIYGVPPGSVQTNVVAYGPVQASVETAKLDGQRTGFAPYFHANRPVGVLAIQLAPGESKTVDITFGKIAQHAEPNVVVTPTVQPVNDVTLPVENATCG